MLRLEYQVSTLKDLILPRNMQRESVFSPNSAEPSNSKLWNSLINSSPMSFEYHCTTVKRYILLNHRTEKHTRIWIRIELSWLLWYGLNIFQGPDPKALFTLSYPLARLWAPVLESPFSNYFYRLFKLRNTVGGGQATPIVTPTQSTTCLSGLLTTQRTVLQRVW